MAPTPPTSTPSFRPSRPILRLARPSSASPVAAAPRGERPSAPPPSPSPPRWARGAPPPPPPSPPRPEARGRARRRPPPLRPAGQDPPVAEACPEQRRRRQSNGRGRRQYGSPPRRDPTAQQSNAGYEATESIRRSGLPAA